MTPHITPAHLAELAVAIWRLAVKLADGPDARLVLAVAETMAAAGLSTHDYDGLPYDPGLAVRVLAFQPLPDLAREEVIETVRPAVHLNGVLLSLGEVIVGTPETTSEEETRP